jgi:hypothetical protein
MQTSSKVSSVKKIGFLASLMNALLKNLKETKPHETIGGKGHYFESMGAINYKFQCRRSQSKRRKLARRTA